MYLESWAHIYELNRAYGCYSVFYRRHPFLFLPEFSHYCSNLYILQVLLKTFQRANNLFHIQILILTTFLLIYKVIISIDLIFAKPLI